jgi:methylated-DNA-[protein]-cysteine S-methyltransferase
LYFTKITNSKIGFLQLTATKSALVSIKFIDDNFNIKENSNDIIDDTIFQLNKYFDGKLKQFTIPLNFTGTDFQIKVWNKLINIPYGQTKSYSEIAQLINNKKAVRAVGNANNKNPIPIIIPCHRVIGKNGKLVGYAGGLEIKQTLLAIENNKTS